MPKLVHTIFATRRGAGAASHETHPPIQPLRLILPNHVQEIVVNRRGAGAASQEAHPPTQPLRHILPNPVHEIIVNRRGAGAASQHDDSPTQPLRPYKGIHVVPGSLGAIVRAYKASVTFRINCLRDSSAPPVWQSNYYDHIIRNDKEYDNIQKYIDTNVSFWTEDQLNPEGS